MAVRVQNRLSRVRFGQRFGTALAIDIILGSTVNSKMRVLVNDSSSARIGAGAEIIPYKQLFGQYEQ